MRSTRSRSRRRTAPAVGCASKSARSRTRADASCKAINMAPQPPLREAERDNWDVLPDAARGRPHACSTCTRSRTRSCCSRCSSSRAPARAAARRRTSSCSPNSSAIAPSSPMPRAARRSTAATCPRRPGRMNSEGRGPAWSNSLFEDNAEFGLGFRLALDKQTRVRARAVWRACATRSATTWCTDFWTPISRTEDGICSAATARRGAEERDWPEAMRRRPRPAQPGRRAGQTSVWIVGGDGWAYDIGYGGLDHVLASRPQCERPGARHRSLLQHRRPDVEVHAARRGRQVCRGWQANGQEGPRHAGDGVRQRLRRRRSPWAPTTRRRCKAFLEAEAYDGPSLIIAYSHCIAHGYDLRYGLEQQKKAVLSGHWPLFRFDPRAVTDAHSGLTLDSKPPSLPLEEYLYNETRYRMLTQSRPDGSASAARAGESGRAASLISSTSSWPATEDDTHELRPICRRRYLGFKLANPLVVSAQPPRAQSRQSRQHGGGGRCGGRAALAVRGADRARESRAGLFPGTRHLQLRRGADPLSRAAQDRAHAHSNTSISSSGPSWRWHIPVIASLNGVSNGGWVDYARLMEEAGADALELNLYFMPTEPARCRALAIEDEFVDVLASREAHRAHSGRGQAESVLHQSHVVWRTTGSRGRRRPGVVQPLPAAGHRPGDTRDCSTTDAQSSRG